MKVVRTVINAPYAVEVIGDVGLVEQMDCAGTTASAAPIIASNSVQTIVAVCRWVDASNFCVQLPTPQQTGDVIEVYAEGGTITIFSPAGFTPSSFLDGSTSVTTSTGKRFRAVDPVAGGLTRWAALN